MLIDLLLPVMLGPTEPGGWAGCAGGRVSRIDCGLQLKECHQALPVSSDLNQSCVSSGGSVWIFVDSYALRKRATSVSRSIRKCPRSPSMKTNSEGGLLANARC